MNDDVIYVVICDEALYGVKTYDHVIYNVVTYDHVISYVVTYDHVISDVATYENVTKKTDLPTAKDPFRYLNTENWNS